MISRARLVHDAIDITAMLREVSLPSNGALLLFVGTVREVNDGRGVTGLDYSAYEPMAAAELQRICDEAAETFSSPSVTIVHRVGELDVGEASVAIAVGHPHRGGAYELSRWMIEQLKQRVPIWKREHYVDGTREWVDPTGQNKAGVAT